MNHLEQLAYEWYEYRGYFVRRNTHVGQRTAGGYECELDIVAFHPTTGHVIHIEPSMDANSWAERERRYIKKFSAGRRYIPFMIPGFKAGTPIEQVAMFGLIKNRSREELAGGKVWAVSDLLALVVAELKQRKIAKEAVPEQYPLLRTIQFMCEHSSTLFPSAAQLQS
jgi:hypothetical protein